MYSHLPPSEMRLQQQNADEVRRAREDNIIERFSDFTAYSAGACPIGYLTTCCRLCDAIIAVPARTERPLCPGCQRIAAEQDRQADEQAEREAQQDAERWDGLS